MTVRIGTGQSAVDPSALRVAGVSPSKIMLGTGSAAVEVWSAFSYPVTGSWGPDSRSGSFYAVGTHTIQQAGSYTLTHSSTNVGGYSFGTSQAQVSGPWGSTTSSYNTKTATATTTQTLAVGDVITMSFRGYNGSTFSGTWSITKN